MFGVLAWPEVYRNFGALPTLFALVWEMASRVVSVFCILLRQRMQFMRQLEALGIGHYFLQHLVLDRHLSVSVLPDEFRKCGSFVT